MSPGCSAVGCGAVPPGCAVAASSGAPGGGGALGGALVGGGGGSSALAPLGNTSVMTNASNVVSAVNTRKRIVPPIFILAQAIDTLIGVQHVAALFGLV